MKLMDEGILPCLKYRKHGVGVRGCCIEEVKDMKAGRGESSIILQDALLHPTPHCIGKRAAVHPGQAKINKVVDNGIGWGGRRGEGRGVRMRRRHRLEL